MLTFLLTWIFYVSWLVFSASWTFAGSSCSTFDVSVKLDTCQSKSITDQQASRLDRSTNYLLVLRCTLCIALNGKSVHLGCTRMFWLTSWSSHCARLDPRVMQCSALHVFKIYIALHSKYWTAQLKLCTSISIYVFYLCTCILIFVFVFVIVFVFVFVFVLHNVVQCALN